MPNRRVCVCHSVILGLLLPLALTMQGCMIIPWLGVIGIDRTRVSDIEFQSFENSWVVAPEERQRLVSMKSIAVMPFAGDPMMAERWATVLREMTDLRVLGPADATRYMEDSNGQIGLAQWMRVNSQVDCVLTGYVVGQESQNSFAGLKERSSQRLYLHLASDSGVLMWKTELLYTIVTGAKNLDEYMVTKALLSHVRAHPNELGFGELGAFNKRSISRSLDNVSEHQMARPLPGERP
jgi:hypothetical protein